jgi:hypothetical protein
MNMTATAPKAIDLRAIAAAIAPGSIRFDPFGFVSGYKAYLIYTALAAKSDAELARMGLERSAISRVAMESAQALHA